MGLGKEKENNIVQTEPCPWEGSEFSSLPMAIDLTLECASNVIRKKRRKQEQEIKRGKEEGIISSGEGSKAKV